MRLGEAGLLGERLMKEGKTHLNYSHHPHSSFSSVYHWPLPLLQLPRDIIASTFKTWFVYGMISFVFVVRQTWSLFRNAQAAFWRENRYLSYEIWMCRWCIRIESALHRNWCAFLRRFCPYFLESEAGAVESWVKGHGARLWISSQECLCERFSQTESLCRL